MSGRRVRVLGHRGASSVAPENTLRAFRAAMEQGADGVELDVRQARGGELVVCHDATLERFSGRRVRVAASSAWALGQIDVGEGEHVPRLESVLEALAGAVVNVEIKTDDGNAVALAWAVARAVQHTRCEVIVSSFDPAALLAIRRIAPGIPRGLLIPEEPLERADVLARAARVAPSALHPHFSYCTDTWLANARAQGYDVNVWTVDDPAEAIRLARGGASAIITNTPAAILAALGEAGL